MPFIEREFSTPVYSEQTDEPKRVVIISCEGSNTEPEYFHTVKRKLSRRLKSLVEVDIVPKPTNDSAPKAVINNLESHIKSKYDFTNQHDTLWIVVDRESVDTRKKEILDAKKYCDEQGYFIAVTNPLFEFWLLLHVTDISKYNKDQLLVNSWTSPSKKRRFIDKELSQILDNGFNKRKGKFNQDLVTLENIKFALQQEKMFCNTMPDILDNLGSNIGDLVIDFLDVN